jgi:F-type H+-transporting ATPase subunit gamma
MATLRDIRGRIVSVKKTQKITKAMKMVAAAKLRRAQRNMLQARPYAAKMKELLSHLTANSETALNPLIEPRATVNAVALVIVTSDRGFCGAFNTNLIKVVERHINANYATFKAEGKLKLFCIGKKGFDYFSKRGYNVVGKYIGVYNSLVFGSAQAIVREVLEGYTKGEYDQVEIAYNEFKSMTTQKNSIDKFLPIPQDGVEIKAVTSADYIYEPSDIAIVNAIVPKHLNFQLWRSLLESNAAEEGARMAAMENATVNATELINTLQLSYNKARQAAITSELLEIVGGAEALRAG